MSRELSVAFTTDVPLVTTAETVLATLSGISTPHPATKVKIEGWAQITLGTATTAVTMRIRRGTAITDTLIGEANAEQISTAAGASEAHTIETEETLGEVANVSYVLTAQQTAATANGAALQGELKIVIDS